MAERKRSGREAEPVSDPSRSGDGADFDGELAALERIVAELEQGGLGLEQSMARFSEGVALLARCQSSLARYRKRVEELTLDAERTLVPFAEDPDGNLADGEQGDRGPRRS